MGSAGRGYQALMSIPIHICICYIRVRIKYKITGDEVLCVFLYLARKQGVELDAVIPKKAFFISSLGWKLSN
jgi:hypothetical protein